MIIYISGPMTGIPDDNKPAFNKAASRLRSLGHTVINPAEIEVPNPSWGAFMREDIKQMMGADAIALLPGWELSRGANLELHIASSVGMQIFDIDDFAVRA